ncbi:hypothetical protein E4U53_002065, partial [Claviceps sorghi]
MLGTFRSTKSLIALVGSAFFFAALVGLVFNHLESWQIPMRLAAAVSSQSPTIVYDTGDSAAGAVSSFLSNSDQLRDFYLKHLFKPSIKPDSPNYKPRDAFEWKLTEKARWQQPMRENLCIIDLDNRKFDEAGQVFGPGILDWGNANHVHGLSLGLLNHYVY